MRKSTPPTRAGTVLAPVLLAGVTLSGLPAVGLAQEESVEQIRSQIEELQRRLDRVEKEAKAEERSLTKWHLAGYTDASYISTDADGVEDTFALGHFNPVFHWMYRDMLLFESELEFELEDGETEVALEYAQLDYFVNDRLTFVAGKYLSPVGQFQERLHPTWVNKMPDAPAGFGHGGAQPLSDVGIQVRGGIPLGGNIATYSLAVGNGPQGGHHGVELEGFAEDNNDDKAVSGRLGFVMPGPGFEIGASFMTAKVPGEEALAGPVTEGDFELLGVDLAYTKGPWDLRAEYLDSELDEFFGAAAHGAATTSLIPKTEWEAWYVQLARQFGKWEPVVRYGELEIDGFFDEGARTQGAVGLNYLFAPSLIGKVAYQSTDPDAPAEEDFDRIWLQIAYGF